MDPRGVGVALLASAGIASAQMPADIAARIKAIGPELTPAAIQATFEIYIPKVPQAAPGVSSLEDLAYGPHERHRLDVFAPAARAGQGMPVVLYVPGGAFVGGAKSRPGLPFFQNVAVHFARNGVVGVTMNYRLAPAHPWPAGGEDVAAALRWIRKNIDQFGGDPERIVLFGQSAGATHVAHYIFDERIQNDGGNDGVVGAILQSPLVEPAAVPPAPIINAYFGAPNLWAERSLLTMLEGRKVPVFLTYAELDPKSFRDEAQKLHAALCKRDGGQCPRTRDLAGHNHMSQVTHIGSADDVSLGRELLDFVRGGR